MTRTWKRTRPTSWRCEPWATAKVVLHGAEKYELFNDKDPACKVRKDSLSEAMEAARRAENMRAHLGEND